MRRTIALVAALLLAGCEGPSDPPTAGPQISVLPSASPVAQAVYLVHPSEVPYGTHRRATLRNTGSVPLEYGNFYVVERKVGDVWSKVEQPEDARTFCAFTGEAYALPPGANKRQWITVCNRDGGPMIFEAGRYSVSKSLRTAGPSEKKIVDVRATFQGAPKAV